MKTITKKQIFKIKVDIYVDDNYREDGSIILMPLDYYETKLDGDILFTLDKTELLKKLGYSII